MKAYIQILCLLGITNIYANKIQQDAEQNAEIVQRNLVSMHNLNFGKDNICQEIDNKNIENWNTAVKELFEYIKKYGTQKQQGAMGVCLAANIDLCDLIKKIKKHINTTKNIQETLAGEVTVILSMIQALEKLESQQNNQPKTPAQLLLNHLIVMLELTLKKTLKDLATL